MENFQWCEQKALKPHKSIPHTIPAASNCYVESCFRSDEVQYTLYSPSRNSLSNEQILWLIRVNIARVITDEQCSTHTCLDGQQQSS